MQHFYDNQIRRYLLQVIRLMSNFYWKDGEGAERQIPVAYGDISRQVANQIAQNSEAVAPSVPRMAVYVTGLAIDNNSIIIVFVFMFQNQFEQINFSIFLGCVGLFLAILNVSPIKTPKLSGKPTNVVALAAYTLGVTIFYSRHLLS